MSPIAIALLLWFLNVGKEVEMKNQEIAKIFYDIADILEIQNIQWKPRAYRKAAQSIESLSEDIEEIYKKGGIKALREIPGIGEALSKKIIEYISTNKIKEYEKLKKQIPRHLSELIEIQSLGPKRAGLLYKKLKIKSPKELEKAIKQHKISKLKTFGIKSEENILKGLQLFKKGHERTLLGIALPISKEIENKLKTLNQVDQVITAGSIRRRKETIKDIDILITVKAKNTKPIMDFFTSMPEVSRILAKGPTKSTIILKNNMQVDVRIIDNSRFGSALQYFTGSKEHSIALRKIAIKNNLKLSEYGLFRKNKVVASKTEQDVYNKLGMQYIEPELRENTGEIQASFKNQLPKLINLNDIKGDLHIHSNYSDGNNSIKQIADAAKKLNYKYICISDHSKGIKIANGLSETQLKKQWKEIDSLNQEIKILKSIELNIKPDGTLDYKNSILKNFDFITAAIHDSFKLDKKKQTNRIIRAMENPYVKMIAHPTGRLINKREPYEIDIEKIFEKASKTNTILEINSFPDRLDLNDVNIREAINKKVKLGIGTDSHDIQQLNFIEFGLSQAKRGWAEKKDIVNCLEWKDLINIKK